MFYKQKKLQSCRAYRRIAPLSGDLRRKKLALDKLLANNLTSRKRFTVVCGPCSADDPDAVEEYLVKLNSVAQRCPDLAVVARIYSAKPHSNGRGYKGAAFNVRASDPIDIDAGIVRCRKMMLRCLQLGLPVADELLYPELFECFGDLVSYWFVGARSSQDSLHRDLLSGLAVCCGVKNATDGDLQGAVNSLYAVSNGSVFPYNSWQVSTRGNKRAHIVLRGGISDGKFFANFSSDDVAQVKKMLRNSNLNDFVMVDLNHANSGKVARNQMQNAQAAILNPDIDGVMIESYLYGGVSADEYGVSQTDDCLGFDETAQVLLELQRAFSARSRTKE